jgi:glutathione synthase
MPQKRNLRKVLFIMDPVEKLDTRWDNSIALAHELTRRGIQCWTADTPQIRLEKGIPWISAKLFTPSSKSRVQASVSRHFPMNTFGLALIRKEPPFNMAYYALTLILEHASIPVVNDPRGIRDANEKMWGLRFKHLMPETMISSSPTELLRFGNQFKDGFVIKPLNEKGGRGIFKVEHITTASRKRIEAASANGTVALVCQRFLKNAGGIDKRIVLLDGKVLCAFEKHPSKKDFRANLGLGASAHPTRLTTADLKIVKTLEKPLRQAGLFLAGLDVMAGKLLEVNVTSPAGMTDAETLYPGRNFIGVWADWLEQFSQQPVLRQQHLQYR